MTDAAPTTGGPSIACLPVAGVENPYQLLMMEGLRTSLGVTVSYGQRGSIFPFLRTMLRSRPEVIHLDWIHQYLYGRSAPFSAIRHALFVLDVLFAQLLGAKFAWTIHNLRPHGRTRVGVLRRWFASRCKMLRVFDRHSRDEIVARFGLPQGSITIVPEGSYVGHYPALDPTRAHRTLTRQVVSVGNLRPYKNTLGLIEAFKTLRPEGWQLLVRGRPFDATYAAQCLAAAKGHPNIVVDLSFVDESELPVLFAGADLVCLPFKQVSNSGSVIMAMGYSKPIVAPRVGAVMERLKNQPELLFDHTDDLASILKRALHMDPDTLAGIGRRNFEALAEYTWEDYGRAFAPILNSGRGS